ncbi:L,D-transpeptidase family protein [Nocardioides sp. zg-DK7169]|uniref:L,D-transpeptidase family protein n=1 Tax=Nocardioides sp. zg-DK7169 TaxID=2736600 RepID=UPI0015528D18|nr:L,D-transpeptidase family protein [Nocardioides sp. zg-DK7169]NPC98543.1 murein L,D-transpeptidase [Nocardioides sp. zg-DK7169]
MSRRLRRLLIVSVLSLLLSTTAYGAGWAARLVDGAWPGPAPAAREPGAPAARDLPDRPGAPATTPTSAPIPAPAGPAPLRPGPRLLGPGDDGAEVRELQARLAQIDWFDADVTGHYGEVTEAAVRGFQAKRQIPVTGEVDRRTLARLHAMTREPSAAELSGKPAGNAAGPLDPRCRTGRVLCVDKTTRTLRWVVDGEVLRTVDTRFGASGTPTREGTFTVYRKSRDHVSSIYGSPMPYAMFFDGGQAVHYSSDFAAVGYAGASHGCVNVRDLDAIAWLYDQVQVGDRVVVAWS